MDFEAIWGGGTATQCTQANGEEPFLEDEEFRTSKIPVADCVDDNRKPILVNSLTDILVSAEVLLPRGGEQVMAKVLRNQLMRIEKSLARITGILYLTPWFTTSSFQMVK